MSSSDALWLSVWGLVAAIGFIIVIIGVIIEGVEHFKKFPKKDQARKLHIEKIGWFLVVGGLAMEFLGDHAAKRISDREAARLNQEAGDARKDSGKAIEQAASANERAAKFELAAAVLESKMKQRIITRQQITDFIFLTEKIPKILISVGIGGQDEPFNFARQIRYMLNQSKFETPNSDTNFSEGIRINHELIFYDIQIGETNNWSDVSFVYNSMNDLTEQRFNYEETNGFIRPVIAEQEIGDTNIVYAAIATCFKQIDILAQENRISCVGTNQCEIFVRQKPQ